MGKPNMLSTIVKPSTIIFLRLKRTTGGFVTATLNRTSPKYHKAMDRRQPETKQQQKQRYNLHYKLRKHGYTIRVSDRHIIRPDETTDQTLYWESILAFNDNYSISNSLFQ